MKTTSKNNSVLGIIGIIVTMLTITIFFFVLLPILHASTSWLIMGVILLIGFIFSLIGLFALTQGLKKSTESREQLAA